MEPAVQAAVIGGIVALIVAALSSFGSEMYKRHRDATALAGGLAGELRVVADALPEILRIFPLLIEKAARGEIVPLPRMKRPTSPVYESRVGDLGLLGPKLAERVAFTYAMIEAFRAMMEVAVASDVKAQEQHAALTAAVEMVRRVEGGGRPLIAALHKFAAREPLESY